MTHTNEQTKSCSDDLQPLLEKILRLQKKRLELLKTLRRFVQIKKNPIKHPLNWVTIFANLPVEIGIDHDDGPAKNWFSEEESRSIVQPLIEVVSTRISELDRRIEELTGHDSRSIDRFELNESPLAKEASGCPAKRVYRVKRTDGLFIGAWVMSESELDPDQIVLHRENCPDTEWKVYGIDHSQRTITVWDPAPATVPPCFRHKRRQVIYSEVSYV